MYLLDIRLISNKIPLNFHPAVFASLRCIHTERVPSVADPTALQTFRYLQYALPVPRLLPVTPCSLTLSYRTQFQEPLWFRWAEVWCPHLKELALEQFNPFQEK